MVVGVVAGAINTIAGGGSLLILPVLMAVGLGANAANATNRVGILAQSVVATVVFGRESQVDWRGASRLVGPVVLGALLGAQISVTTPEWVLRGVIGGMLVVVLISLWMRPKRWLVDPKERVRALSPLGTLALFSVGLYAGFLQAGVGVLFLMVLVWGTHRNLVAANGLKVLLVAILTVPALGLFAAQGLVSWPEGIALGVGQVIGGVIGAHSSVRWGPAFVRWVLLITVVGAVLGLLLLE